MGHIEGYPREDQFGASQQTPKALQHLFHTGFLVWFFQRLLDFEQKNIPL
jgi:hypothetical protein